MEPAKYSFDQARKIDQDTKLIYKYPTNTKQFDIGHMIVDGRHPIGVDKFILEHECSFIMYILKGSGRVFAGDQVFEVSPTDVVLVPANNKFAVEGKFEYITFDSPAFYPEQSEEVNA